MNLLKKAVNKIADKIVEAIDNSFSLEEKQKWIKQRKRLELSKKVEVFQQELRRQIYTFISSALGFVAALFWRDALVEMLKEFVPSTEQWLPKLLVAIVISVLAVVGILLINEVLMKRYRTKRV
jgi:hypothetical protein